MLDYAAARAVALVVRTGSFEAAARVLGITPSAVSQRVRKLEEHLGLVLIQRGVPCRATERGDWLCRHIDQLELMETALRAHLPLPEIGVTGRAVLKVAVNADSLGTWFLPALAPALAEAGHLIDITLDDEDHTADWLRRGRVIAAVTTLAQPVQGCKVTRLGRLRYVATAAPALVRQHFAGGIDAVSLAQAPALTFNARDRLQQDWARQVLGQAVDFPTHYLPSTQGFVDASLAGLGWALNPSPLVRDHLAAGRLVALVPDAPLDRTLYWQVSHLAAAPLATLTRALRRAARAMLLS